VACGCGNSGTAGGPLLSGVLTGQYGDNPGVESVLATSGAGDGVAAASVAGSPCALFNGVGGFLAVLLFIGIAALVVRGASKKSE
jgi:hypothetical protein